MEILTTIIKMPANDQSSPLPSLSSIFNTLTAFDYSYPMPEIRSQPTGLFDIISLEKRIAHDAPRPESGAPRNADPAQSSSDELLFVSDSSIWSSSGTRLAHTAPRIETGTPRNAGSEYSISQNPSKQVQGMPESTILMSAERRIEDAMPKIASDAPRNAEPGYRITQNPSYQVLEGPDSTILMRTDRRVAHTTPRGGKSAPRNADFKEGLQVIEVAEGESGPSGFATRSRAKSVVKSGNWTGGTRYAIGVAREKLREL